eukprot:m.76230 g.76230  ORF g.76230 m.76230 type:complete len:61 (+) comp12482_c0_seq2:1048-1230(+)
MCCMLWYVCVVLVCCDAWFGFGMNEFRRLALHVVVMQHEIYLHFLSFSFSFFFSPFLDLI